MNPIIASKPGPLNAPLKQRGVTLIEILITLLILAVGLLGLAALQSISLQSGQVAYQRSQAVSIAYEVADFARANRSVAAASDLQTLATNMATRMLPSGTATVTGPAGTTNEITVTISWSEERLEDLESDSTLTETFSTRI